MVAIAAISFWTLGYGFAFGMLTCLGLTCRKLSVAVCVCEDKIDVRSFGWPSVCSAKNVHMRCKQTRLLTSTIFILLRVYTFVRVPAGKDLSGFIGGSMFPYPYGGYPGS